MILSEQVRRVIKAENISEDELVHMIAHAAPATSERGNRRFHHWLFAVQTGTGTVLRMSQWEVPTYHRKGTADMETFDECEPCEGGGCKVCGWTGEVHMKYTTK